MSVRGSFGSVVRSVGLRVAAADPLLVVLGILAAGYFAYVYITDPGRPGELDPAGWFITKGNGPFDKSDQYSYLALARDLADFRLPARDFTYGLGYPALAVPFIWLGLDYDPFLVFDGVAFVFVAMATYITALRLSGGSRVVAAVAGYGLVFASPLVVYVDKPWNSTVSLVAAAVILLVGTAPATRAWHAPVMGLMVGAGFAARYVDAIWLAALAVAAMVTTPRATRVHDLVRGAGTALVLVGLVLVAHQLVLGSVLTTPYESHLNPVLAGSDQNLGAYDLTRVPESAFGEFISPFLLGNRYGGEPFLQAMFWSLLAIPGAALALRRGAPRRVLVATLVAGAIISTVFYLSFRGSGPGAVQFGGLHYFKMWWPGLAVLAAIALGALGRYRPRAGQGPRP